MLREFLKLSNGKELDVVYPIELKDSKGNEIYFETSKGVIRGTERAETVELTVADIEKLLGKSIKIVKG